MLRSRFVKKNNEWLYSSEGANCRNGSLDKPRRVKDTHLDNLSGSSAYSILAQYPELVEPVLKLDSVE